MEANPKTIHDPSVMKADRKKKCFLFVKLAAHLELVAALTSGLLILLAWGFSGSISPISFIILHVAAFMIGGYAKAKEGILDTMHDKQLNVELLMILAAIGSAAIGYWTEGAVLIFIFALSGALETYTMNKSNKEISALMELQPEDALRINHGEIERVKVEDLTINDTILVRAGERIPADGIIENGETAIDESTITGESMPVLRKNKEEVFAGTVALDGTIYIKITKRASETLFQKIIQMVQNAKEERSPAQLFIERFEGTYVKAVLGVVAIMMFLPYLFFGWSFSESIYRAMILLVVASPCALVASIMPATLSAISNSAKNGVLFKGGVHLENLAHIKAIAFDKTGTLTNGKPFVTDALYHPDVDADKILAAAAAIEKESTHPLAKAIVTFAQEKLKDHKDNEVIISRMKTAGGKGVRADVEGHLWEIVKPENDDDLMEGFAEYLLKKLAEAGKTITLVKVDGKTVAVFGLKDTIRTSGKKIIQTLKSKKIEPVMLTGDNGVTAKAIASEAGLNHYIANCLPGEKMTHIKNLRHVYSQVAMVGDGINDAPALASADVSIAMGEGTDVALETADVILMKSDLQKIGEAMTLSKRMNRIVKQNIFFSLAVITLLILSNFLQVIDLPFGVIGHEGSTILVILNGLRLLK
ncbi:heavy metal translocating P-type ATPase [Virgibacillus halophilus]|uniref:heavy metal translocating P-type ATPase n=1 Tax=Tigheibacillus halophilus TaxID=361280 RepID=UPI003636524A